MNASSIKAIVKGNETESSAALQTFVETALQTFSFPELNNNNQRRKLWAAIFTLANSTTNPTVLTNCFIAIRILSREKAELNELITDEWLQLIQTHAGLNDPNFAFDNEKLLVAVEVQKCLCNLMFNSSVAAGLCCKNGILQQLTDRLKKCESSKIPEEVKFFDVKQLFLLTALRSEIRNKVRTEMDGVAWLIKSLDVNLKKVKQVSDGIIMDDQAVDIVCEVFKALFNLTLNCYGNSNDKGEDEQCEHLVVDLRMYLLMPTSSKEKSLALKSNVVNLLTNIPDEYYKHLISPIQPGQSVSNKFHYGDYNMTAVYEILMFLKDQMSEESEGVSKQYEVLSPVATVLLKCANSDRSIRKFLRLQILPPLKDVHTRPEEGSTHRNHLCRLLTTPITQLRDLVAEFLFILCKKSVRRMIKYTGYGNAAGLFAQRGLLGGKSDAGEADFSSDSDSETEEYAKFKHGINPVVGCYEEPHANPMESMTEEQKEYEAMKLVELMDNLTKCGAIQPCRVGADGKPHPIEHVLQLQEGLKAQQINNDSDSD